jgi:succinate dehydrogenase/fumarate reductase-like Fe-S protein
MVVDGFFGHACNFCCAQATHALYGFFAFSKQIDWLNYPGPTALVKAARFIADTRDTASNERLNWARCEDGVWRCHTIFNCAEACPKSIDPPNFIQYLKRKTKIARR